MAKIPEARPVNVCFTMFKDNDDNDLIGDIDIEQEIIRNAFFHPRSRNKIKYIICQTEICPKTGGRHIQGYCEFHDGQSFRQIKKLFNNNCMHIEIRKGTQDEAINYCKKEESFCQVKGWRLELGTKKRQGARSDLEEIFNYIVEGHTVRETIMEFREIGMFYHNHIYKTTMAFHGFGDIGKYDQYIKLKRELNNPDMSEKQIQLYLRQKEIESINAATDVAAGHSVPHSIDTAWARNNREAREPIREANAGPDVNPSVSLESESSGLNPY